MKTLSLFKKSGFLIKSFALGLLLMVASATSSFAQYIQIEVTLDPYSTVPNPYYMQMKVYADAACTIPSTYSGSVKYNTGSTYGCNPYISPASYWTTVNDFNAANLLYYGNYINLRWEDECGGHIEDIIDTFYGIETGPSFGYNVATVPVVFL